MRSQPCFSLWLCCGTPRFEWGISSTIQRVHRSLHIINGCSRNHIAGTMHIAHSTQHSATLSSVLQNELETLPSVVGELQPSTLEIDLNTYTCDSICMHAYHARAYAHAHAHARARAHARSGCANECVTLSRSHKCLFAALRPCRAPTT
jgi:hypothetical protein